jgi:hypothetical protein
VTPAHGRRTPRRRRAHPVAVGDEPDLVDAVALSAQHLAQLALQEKALLAGGAAGTPGGATTTSSHCPFSGQAATLAPFHVAQRHASGKPRVGWISVP